MRPIIRMFVLAAATVSASAAFAASKVTVNVPFNFEAHGKVYDAGQYDVKLDTFRNVLTLSNHNNPGRTLIWTVSPAESGPDAPMLSMKFNDSEDGQHTLRSIRMGERTTPVLDVREKHAVQSTVSITGGQ